MGHSRKRKGSDEPESAIKRSKATEPSVALTKPEEQKDGDGRPYWELSNKRRVQVTEFKGKSLVGLREFYEKDGKWLPGKAGISLTIEQYSVLVMALPAIETKLAAQGISVPRPEYSVTDINAVDDAVDDAEDEEDEEELVITTAKEVKRKENAKKNYESTSEDE